MVKTCRTLFIIRAFWIYLLSEVGSPELIIGRGDKLYGKRSDRALRNSASMLFGPNTNLDILPLYASDHTPLVLHTNRVTVFRKARFKFQNFLLLMIWAYAKKIIKSSRKKN